MVVTDNFVDYKLGRANRAKSYNKPKPNKGKSKKKEEGKIDNKKKDNGSKMKYIKFEGQSCKPEYTFGCFLCNGPHCAKDCPKREKQSAIIVEEMNDSKPDIKCPIIVNSLQVLSIICEVVQSARYPGFLYVKVVLNFVEIVVMIDTGATHNFVTKRMVEKLGLKVSKHQSKIKSMNVVAHAVQGMSHDVPLQMGAWKNQLNLMVVPLDDFDVIFGNDFLIRNKVVPMPYLCELMIFDDTKPCFCARSDI
ncbi:gag-asp_proteas domain-containing protein [Cephalotus follicularis]|uniref:Gag-asp_proteas domain-containing protein n=1 Tax=Cephalotus follicularis TaxID=3775 RepID=A0A1Q3AT45_CEPFO|nr:gag-asp_proteas domain-containing protein [Cephalotus follicularis]